jgi:type II secretion system protein H
MKSQSSTLNKSGFTLIELVLVIFIISLVSAFAVPYLWNSGERAVKSDARRLSSSLRYVHDESTAKKLPFTFRFDLENRLWEFKGKSEKRSFKMNDNVYFRDIILPSQGNISAGELILTFSATGTGEPFTVHLSNDETDYTVIFNHISGRVNIYKGYRT